MFNFRRFVSAEGSTGTLSPVTSVAARAKPRRFRLPQEVQSFFDSLSGRLLVLTAAAVLLFELMIFVPALSGFHYAWLQERTNLAQTAALALAVAPEDYEITDRLETELLQNAEVKRIAMRRAEARELILDSGPVTGPIVTRDFTKASGLERFGWAFDTFFAPDGRVLRVLARPRFEAGDYIEVVLNEAPLKKALGDWALQFALISTLILASAASLMFAVVTLAFVRPMRELTHAIERFRDAPEDASVAFVRSARADEIGRAERAAADMAEQLRASLRQRERLAALGAAVARIGHDLRNMLSTAQLVTDRLSSSEDPTVRQIAPRLERSISRAVQLAASTLKFGRADESAPLLRPLDMRAAVEGAIEDALASYPELTCRIEIAETITCKADADHLHRVLVNLLRNGAQAMGGKDQMRGGLLVHGFREGRFCYITLEDCGPGMPDKVRLHLFEPFVTAGGGTGLGLAISRELARSMGGDVALLRTDDRGTSFQVTLRVS